VQTDSASTAPFIGSDPDAPRGDEGDAARGERDLSERAHQQRAPFVREPRLEPGAPRRPLALDRREQQRRDALLARRFQHGGRGKVRRKRAECAMSHELAHVGPRF
jgi:hypothetical protein